MRGGERELVTARLVRTKTGIRRGKCLSGIRLKHGVRACWFEHEAYRVPAPPPPPFCFPLLQSSSTVALVVVQGARQMMWFLRELGATGMVW